MCDRWDDPQVIAQVAIFVIVLLLSSPVQAMKLCWQNPTQNVDGSALTDLAAVSIYKDGLRLSTLQADGPGTNQCSLFRIAEGTYNFNMTAMDADGNESALSNTVQKTESRLGGPSGGDVLQGPSGGTVITDGDDNG